jgi:Ser/Thr protein kinase RdoA (MazF antagonist)
MKVDPLDIDKQALRQLLRVEYGLNVATLTLLPEGEEGYSYVAETPSKMRYFVKVYDDLRPSNLNLRFQAAARLHMQCGLDYVVHPHGTKQGRFLSGFDKYAVAVFNFVEGATLAQRGFSDKDWAQVATMMASLHANVHCPALPPLPEEQFEITFKDWLFDVLAAAQHTSPPANEHQRQTRTLLSSEKHDVLATLEKLEQLAEQARTRACQQSLTHGDFNPGNIVKDKQGDLHVIDWSKIAIGPPEQDLICFAGERFESFLAQYVRACEHPPRLHAEIFEYYIYFLILGGIADYGSWILLENANLAETQHAWGRLKQHLPIDHEYAQVQVNGIAQVIERVMGDA